MLTTRLVFYCVMVIIALILIFVTCIGIQCPDLASNKYVDLDVFILCIDVPTQTRKFLIYTHWFYPPQGEQRQSFPPLFCLASVGFIFHYLRPSITFQFQPTTSQVTRGSSVHQYIIQIHPSPYIYDRQIMTLNASICHKDEYKSNDNHNTINAKS